MAPTVSLPTPDPGLAAGTVISIVSGETGLPVAGASLFIGGRATAADAAGRVTLPQRLERDTPIDVTAPGHLDRLTRLRSTQAITLWPKQSPTGLDENFSSRLVYSPSGGDAPTFGAGLVRLGDATRRVFVVPAPEVETDPRATANLQEAARRLMTAHGGRIEFVVGSSAPAGVVRFDAVRDRSQTTCSELVLAFVRWQFSGFTIIGGVINFCRADALHSQATATHELGHVFGLRHSPDTFDLMYPIIDRREDFSAREGLAMRLMLLRPPGNAYPDTDRHVTFASGAQWSATIVCPR